MKKMILANVAKKAKAGKYDPKLAAKAWEYWVTEGAKRYGKEFGTGNGLAMFSHATRRSLAVKLALRYPRGEEN
jgi:hypothetical protein